MVDVRRDLAAGDEIDAKGRASRAGEDQARRLDEVIRALRALPWGSVIAVLIVAGCAALAPARATDPKLQPWQDFADATAKAYGKWYAPRVEYALPNSTYEGARWSLGTIYVRGELLDRPTMPLLFAHELGHYVLEHRGGGPQAEMEANAQAVDILVRVRPGRRAAGAHGIPPLPGRRAPIAGSSGRGPRPRGGVRGDRRPTPALFQVSGHHGNLGVCG